MAMLDYLTRQRRFKWLLVSLVILALLLGLLIVPVESRHPGALIKHWFDGIWWSWTTITSVGYGDFYPVTKTGKVIGIILEIVGVLSFGLLIGMMTVALDEGKNRFYWQRLFERLDRMEKRLEQTERREEYVVRQVSGAESTQVAEPKAHGMERDGNGKEQEESQN